MFNLPENNKVQVRLFEQIFSDMNNSYKIYWFKGIFEEIITGKKEITFKEIVCRMVAQAWYPLNIYHLNLGVLDKLEETVEFIKNVLHIQSNINQNDLYYLLKTSKNKDIDNKLKLFYRYVPYRLLAPFFKTELKELSKDYDKQKRLMHLLAKSEEAVYKVEIENEKIIINTQWYDYIRDNQNIIKGWINYNLLQYLQNKNPNVPAIIDKLIPPNERDLSFAKKYWTNIINGTSIKDIYTCLEFTNSNYNKYGGLSIDHFIPWSFVGHDKLWNLVPTFSRINSSKNDNLPKLNDYLDRFCEVQYIGFNYMKDKCSLKKLDDFIDINKTINLKEISEVKSEINKDIFIKDLKSTIIPLYQIAFNQGFNEWENGIWKKVRI